MVAFTDLFSSKSRKREIKVFVGSVDANKECIGDVLGVRSCFVFTARTQADRNIEWLLPAI